MVKIIGKSLALSLLPTGVPGAVPGTVRGAPGEEGGGHLCDGRGGASGGQDDEGTEPQLSSESDHKPQNYLQLPVARSAQGLRRGSCRL